MTTRVILLFLLTFSIVNAEIRYVSKAGGSIPPYTSWATAADSIQKAIDVCSYGDTVYVGTGVYYEMVEMIQGLTLLGSGIDSSVIDISGDGQGGVAVRMKHNTVLKYFEIICDNYNTTSLYDHPIKVSDSINPKRNVIIESNKLVSGSSLIMSNNLYGKIINNILLDGYIGIDLSTNQDDLYQLVENNLISALRTTIEIPFGAKPEIRNNILISEEGYIFYTWGIDTLKMFNNLMLLNGESDYIWAINSSGDKEYFINNVILGKWESGIVGGNSDIIKNNIVSGCKYGITWYENMTPVIEYNNCRDNDYNYVNRPVNDSTNVSVYPMFANTDSGDYHLQMFSPLINAGDPGILNPDGSRSDIGLYGGPFGESYQYIDYPPLMPGDIHARFLWGKVTLDWEDNHEADFSHYLITKEYNNSGITEETTTDTSIYFEYPAANIHSAKYRVSSVDRQGNKSQERETSMVLTEVEKEQAANPGFLLLDNYPNPFNPRTKIIFHLEAKSDVRLTIYDVKGEIIAELMNESKDEGWHEVEYNPGIKGNDITSGIYVYMLEVRKGNKIIYSKMGKMVMLK